MGYARMSRRVLTKRLEMMEPWSSVDEVAKHLGVAQDSIYRSIEGRGLPAHKIGRLWKFKLSEVDEWVCAGCAEGGRSQPRKGREGQEVDVRARSEASLGHHAQL